MVEIQEVDTGDLNTGDKCWRKQKAQEANLTPGEITRLENTEQPRSCYHRSRWNSLVMSGGETRFHVWQMMSSMSKRCQERILGARKMENQRHLSLSRTHIRTKRLKSVLFSEVNNNGNPGTDRHKPTAARQGRHWIFSVAIDTVIVYAAPPIV